MTAATTIRRLVMHREALLACRRCATVIGPPVCHPPRPSRIYLVGQAPGPREGARGRPFAHTAGKTLFRWFEAHGVDEAAFREGVYMSAVLRCFPGKAPSGGDRLPSAEEMAACRPWLAEEVALMKPQLIVPVGRLAIEQVLGARPASLAEVVGRAHRVKFLGRGADAIALPHPSGVSSWHKLEPGKSLLAKALGLIVSHPAWRAAFAG